jgi:hypothetical protein
MRPRSVTRGIGLFLTLLLVPACGHHGGPPAAPVFSPSFPLSDIRLGTNPPGAVSEVYPQVACDGNTVYAVWLEQKVSPTQFAIRFCRSTDAGVTWPTSTVNLSPTAPLSDQLTQPMLACDGPNVYVVWSDGRSGTANLYFNRSLDGGLTWLPSDTRIAPSPGNALTWKPEICCSGLNVYVCWNDRRRSATLDDVYFNRSLDGGLTWLGTDVQINDSVGGTANNVFQSLACNGNQVCVAWTDYRSGDADIYVDISADAGATWLASDVRVDHAPAGINSLFPIVTCSSSTIVVDWSDARSGSVYHAFENRSLDGGTTWRATDLMLDGAFPAIQGFSGQVWAFGLEVYTSFANGGRIYFSRSADGGDSWSPPVRIDQAPGAGGAALGPLIQVCGNTVFVVWQDTRNGLQDLYFRYSNDGGASWIAPETRLNSDPPGSANAEVPSLAGTPAHVYCIWFDYRNGQPNIYFIGG